MSTDTYQFPEGDDSTELEYASCVKLARKRADYPGAGQWRALVTVSGFAPSDVLFLSSN